MNILYHQSRYACNIKVAVRPNRAADKIVFKIPTKCTSKYLNSSYYLGTQLWNNLSIETQRLDDLATFDKRVSPMYKNVSKRTGWVRTVTYTELTI